MTNAPYPRYKTSGVEWLGKVPEHWRVNPIKYLVSTPVTDGPHETPEILEAGVPFVSAEAVSGGRINFEAVRGHISVSDHERFSKKYRPRLGDIYVVKSGATTGRIAMVETEKEFSIWSPLAAIRCNPRLVDRRFVHLYLQSRVFQTAIELSWSYGTQQNIGMGVIQELSVPVPPLHEQAVIAQFLSAETAKLDKLIAKQKTLIERLKEKRTALISRTVTRGLPPNAARAAALDPHPKLKHSGVDWLGEVPEHWSVKPLRRFVQFRGGATPDKGTQEYWEGTIPWVSPKDMKVRRIGEVPDHVSNEALENSALTLLQVKSVLIVVRGMILAHSFPVAITDTPVTINQDMKALVAGRGIDAEFLLWLLIGVGPLFVSLADESAHGTRKLESETVGRFRVAAPPLAEQRAIADFLDHETAKIDTLAAKVETAIERLQEYRTALITAAVTGKIDVRAAVA